MCFPTSSDLLCYIELVCFLHMAAGKAWPHAAASAQVIILKDMVRLTSSPSVFVGQTELPVGQLYIFSCKCRSAGCCAVYSLSLKAQVLTCNFTVHCICLSCKKAHFASIASGSAALVTLAVLPAWQQNIFQSMCCRRVMRAFSAVSLEGFPATCFGKETLISPLSMKAIIIGCDSWYL